MNIWYTGYFDNDTECTCFIFTEEVDLSNATVKKLTILCESILSLKPEAYVITNDYISIKKLSSRKVQNTKTLIESLLLLEGEL